MSVPLSAQLFNDKLTWIRRLEKLHHRKLLTMGLSRLRCLQYTSTNAAGNCRDCGLALYSFSNPSTRQNKTTSSEIAVNVYSVGQAQLTMSSQLLALEKIAQDDDRP